MNTAPSSERSHTRRSYVKPAMKRVVLKPEEAVLGACKATGTFGPTAGNCNQPLSCSAIGS